MDSTEAAIGHQHDNVARLVFGHDGPHDRLDLRNVPGALPSPRKIRYEILRRETFRFRQRRSEHPGDDDLIGVTKGLCKLLLKDTPAR